MHRALAVLALALPVVACAPVSVLPYVTDRPPTATLPVALAGIVDARAEFAPLFASELRARAPAPADPEVSHWLNGVAAVERSRASDRIAAAGRVFAARAPSTVVLVVPGLFGDCVDDQSLPFGDGRVRDPADNLVDAYRQYDDLGLLGLRAVPVRGRAKSETNAPGLAAAIRAEAARPGVARVVLVAYSKGVADTLHALAALQASGGVPAQLVALVSVAGAVMGTPVADTLEWLYGAVSPHVDPLHCTPSEGSDLGSVTRRERIAWLAAHPPPPGLRYYTVVAHAPGEEIAPPLRPFYRQLAANDPRNDGQLLASDAMLPASTLLAEARADHWDVALPRDRHPNPFLRGLTSGRAYPREALLRAVLKWVIGGLP